MYIYAHCLLHFALLLAPVSVQSINTAVRRGGRRYPCRVEDTTDAVTCFQATVFGFQELIDWDLSG